ncbi:MAG: bis(5'-nucleosyl)-tetraphosphatase (symmetrical) YqeK [Negativicutes bacterium]|nr:bis(5'-nucleosyl)-tetraphosphatase (symmetrical) YqeK [Negativicutes bacterium]
MSNFPEKEIALYLQSKLSAKRWRHTLGCQQTAIQLAERYSLDALKASQAALCHDYCRSETPQQLLQLAEELHYTCQPAELQAPILLHGPLAALLLQRDWQVEDAEILEAVHYHTTGRLNLGALAKVIFLADGIEPQRDYPGVEELRHLAQEDLDAACLAFLQTNLAYLQQKGMAVHPFSYQWLTQLKELMERTAEKRDKRKHSET